MILTSEDRINSIGVVKSPKAAGHMWSEMPCDVRKVMVVSRGKVACDPGQLKWNKEAAEHTGDL